MTEQQKYINELKYVLVVMFIGFVVMAVGLFRERAKEPIVVHKIIKVVDPNYVQCPAEAQERLKTQGLYDGKIDNIWGKETDKAYCDWCAIQTFKPDYLEK